MTSDFDVAVLGLGPMGLPMAKRLVASGHRVVGWNRSEAPRSALAAAGGAVVAAVSDAAAPVLLSVLPDVDQLREVLAQGLLPAIRETRRTGDLPVRIVVMSTTSPQRVRALAEELAPEGIRIVDAPVSGGDRGAQEGTLSIMIGGDEDDVLAVRPVLDDLGGLVVHLGPLGSGAMAKLCNQIIVAGNLTATAEALAVAEAAGLPLPEMIRIFSNGLARSGVLELKAEKWLSGRYDLGGSAKNQQKDLRYLEGELGDLGVETPITHALLDVFERLLARGWGEEDHAVVIELLRGVHTRYSN